MLAKALFALSGVLAVSALNHDLLSRNLLSLRQSSNLPIDVPDECTPSCDSLGSVYTACAGADTQTCTDALCQQDAFNDVLDCANCVAENTPGSEQTDQTFAALSTVLAEIEGLCANANETVTGMITATGATVSASAAASASAGASGSAGAAGGPVSASGAANASTSGAASVSVTSGTAVKTASSSGVSGSGVPSAPANNTAASKSVSASASAANGSSSASSTPTNGASPAFKVGGILAGAAGVVGAAVLL